MAEQSLLNPRGGGSSTSYAIDSKRQDTIVSNNTGGGSSHKLYAFRWLVLSAFCFLSASNAIVWITYSPMAIRAAKYWDVPSSYINALAMVYMFLFVVGFLPAAALIQRFGLRVGLWTAAIFNLAGGWVRYVGSGPGEHNFVWQMAGQTLCAISQCFFLGAPARLSFSWFGAHERTRATAIAALLNQVGIGLGFLLAPTVASSDDRIPLLMLIEACFCTLAAALILGLYRNHPPTPPSSTANLDDTDTLSFSESLRILGKTFSFWILTLLFSLGTGAFYGISTLLDQLIEPAGYSSGDAGWFGFVLLMVGVAGALIAAWVADKTHAFRALLLFVSVALCVSFVWFSVEAVRSRSKGGSIVSLIACCSAIGAFSSSLVPLAMEAAAEITHPVSAELSSNIIMGAAQIFGIILIIVIPVVGFAVGIDIASWLLAITTFLAVIIALCFKPRYRRQEVEVAFERTYSQGS